MDNLSVALPTLYLIDNRPGPGAIIPLRIMDSMCLFEHFDRLPELAAFDSMFLTTVYSSCSPLVMTRVRAFEKYVPQRCPPWLA